MIEEIAINNLGVISQAVLKPGPELTVLTGETGAGKTMVLTSLGLLLGQRAEPQMVRQGHERAVVDGVFDIKGIENIAKDLNETGISAEENLLYLSRTVPKEGRSRAHAGGRPVPASVLAQIGSKLVTVHGQADQLRLKNPKAQRELLDKFAGVSHQKLLEKVARAYGQWQEAKIALEEWREERDTLANEAIELARALKEIDALNPTAGEDEELRWEAERLSNVEELRNAVAGAYGAINGAEVGEKDALGLIEKARSQLSTATKIDESLQPTLEEIEKVALLLADGVEELRSYLGALDSDPHRLQEVHERRAALKNVCLGRAEDATKLIEWAQIARHRYEQISNPEDHEEYLTDELEKCRENLVQSSALLSRSRAKAGKKLAAKVTAELHYLAMVQASLHVRLVPRKDYASYGNEEISLELQTHPDATPVGLGQGASGGELSRIMLAIEVATADNTAGRVFVFDEIDAGIGGRAATAVGARLKLLAKTSQVIVVTHLAQVAAYGKTHLVVEKDGITTKVSSLSGQERVDELARMLSGSNTKTALQHAQELIEASNVEQSAP